MPVFWLYSVLNTCSSMPIFQLFLNAYSGVPVFWLFLNTYSGVVVFWFVSECRFLSHLVVHAQD